MITEKWRGAGKLVEEAGEVLQIIGKLMVFPSGDHPDDKGNLGDRVTLEISDLYAALDYFVEANGLSIHTITLCRHAKLQKYRFWQLPGISRTK